MGVTGSLMRGVSLADDVERYYDSLAANVLDISTILNINQGSSNNPKLYLVNSTYGFSFTENTFYTDHPGSITWQRSFPFQGALGTMKREIDIRSSFYSNDLDAELGIATLQSGSIESPGIVNGPEIITDILVKRGSGSSRLSATTEEKMKYFFGFGDRGIGGTPYGTSTYTWNQVIKGNSPGGVVEDTETLTSSVLVQTTNYVSIGLRGFKYGLINAVPMNSRAVFRHNRHGQFRDMLEQRHMTRYQKGVYTLGSAVRCRFFNYDGESVTADQTHCQNLNHMSTSSLPFFDMDGRLRDAEDKLVFIGKNRDTDPDDIDNAAAE
jgi:hypothetical protein